MSLTLSVVVPMYNEEAVLPLFIDELRPVLDSLDVTYEVLCVDDGSRDRTPVLVEEALTQWPEIRLVRLLRNSGHQAALSAGYELALGDYVVTIDADLQDPPIAIGQMLEVARSQRLDVVYGVREDRSTDGFLKRVTARGYYRLMRRLAGDQMPMDAGDFRLVSRRVVEAIDELPQHSRVHRLIIPWYGFPSAEVTYRRARRAAGESKYPFMKMVTLAVDSITTFSAAPLKLAIWSGALGVIVCLLAMVWAVGAWLSDNTAPGWTSIVGTVGLIGALQLICIGLLGEYVSRLFISSQGRPTYRVGYDSGSLRATEPGRGDNPGKDSATGNESTSTAPSQGT